MCSRLNDKPPARSSVWLGVRANHATPSDLVRRSFYPPLPFDRNRLRGPHRDRNEPGALYRVDQYRIGPRTVRVVFTDEQPFHDRARDPL
jgi:hypothetical protein